MKNIVVIGGGTGPFVVLSGLKEIPDVVPAAVISVADNGGSSGVLRDEHGVLPPGDLLRAMLALSEETPYWRDLLAYRFPKGTCTGHTFGNLLLTALQNLHANRNEAVAIAHTLLKVRGRVHPVTFGDVTLVAEYADGTTMRGEDVIDRHDGRHGRIARCYLDRTPKANPSALEAIASADLLVLGPGDIHTSVVPCLLVPGVTDAIAANKGTIAMPLNLACKRGQTDGYTATGMVAEMERYLGGTNIGRILVNDGPIPDGLRKTYAAAGEDPVVDDLPGKDARIARRRLIAPAAAEPVQGDAVRRSLLRHDPAALAAALMEILAGTA